MHASSKFLHPEAIRRIGRLELRARHVVEGFLSGIHRSPYFGRSIEFLQHRQYVRGDDVRHIDWKVWGKQDRLYIKQYEEETNLRCTLLVDVSKSMRYGQGAMTKYDYAATIATSLAYLLLRQQDAVGCVAFDAIVRSTMPLRSKRNHLMSIVRALENNEPTEKTDMGKVLHHAAETFPARGMMVLISDLLCDREKLFQGLRMLEQRGHDVLVFHVMDDDELDFPFSGPTRFDGLETDDRIHCNPRALREGYMQALQAFLEEVRFGAARYRCDYSLFRTSDPLDAVLARFLTHRTAIHHHQ
jgi:uncharacterized protein (DUF58 family)